MEEIKREDVELLTGFTGGKAIGKKGNDFYIVSQISGTAPKKLNIWAERDLKATNFDKGVAIVSYDVDTQYDKRYESYWETRAAIVTPSGYTVGLGGRYNSSQVNDEINQELIDYARSIFDNPAEILKIDKKLKTATAECIKAFVDIAKAGLEASLEKAGEEFSRTSAYGNGMSEKEKQKATAKYHKTLDLLEDLSKKITVKFHKLQEKLDREQAKTPKNRAAAVGASIKSIIDEPQRGQ